MCLSRLLGCLALATLLNLTLVPSLFAQYDAATQYQMMQQQEAIRQANQNLANQPKMPNIRIGQPDVGKITQQLETAANWQANRARLEAKTKRLRVFHYLAPVIGIMFWGGVFIFVRMRKRQQPGSSQGGKQAEARAFADAIKGKQSPDALAKCVFNALRFGNYMEYAALFPTQVEAQKIMIPEKFKAYWAGPRAQENLRPTFEALREACFSGQATLQSVEIGSPTLLKTPDQQSLNAISGSVLVVQSREGQTARIPLGSLVELPSGWKLFMPKKPDHTSNVH